MGSTLHSPNELLQAARDTMLEGKDPASHKDWQIVFNFFAFNIHSGVQPAALLLMQKIFDAPLTEDEIREISSFQIKAKGENHE